MLALTSASTAFQAGGLVPCSRPLTTCDTPAVAMSVPWRLAGAVGVAGGVTLAVKALRSKQAEDDTLGAIKADLAELITSKSCGPIMIRLSWHDAGVYSTGKLTGGCPNAAMRFTDAGEGTFGANAGLPDVALGLLAPIAEKYEGKISNADLWALAANVGIETMGGPAIPTRFGRVDAASSAESVESEAGRLPDGDKGLDHLREIFYPKGFDDKDIVALSGAHTVGRCSVDRSGFDGQWTEDSLKFDNTYFKEMLSKQYVLGQVCASPPPSAPPADLAHAAALGAAADDEPSLSPRCPGVLQAAGNPEKPQYEHKASGTIMLISDLALLEDDAYKTCPRDAAPTPRHQQVSSRSAARTLVLLGGAGTSSGTRRTRTRTLRTSPQHGSSCRRTASPSCATRCERTAAGRARKDRSGLLPPDSPSFPALSLRRTLWPVLLTTTAGRLQDTAGMRGTFISSRASAKSTAAPVD